MRTIDAIGILTGNVGKISLEHEISSPGLPPADKPTKPKAERPKLIRMNSFRVHPADTRVRAQDKDLVYVALLLGAERKDGTKPIDVEQALAAMGYFKRDDPFDRLTFDD